jgi:site-specific DNA-cytosine methylase
MAVRPLSQMCKPRLLDLFCCAGGAGIGYSRAGFEVVGVDVNLFQFDVRRTHYQLC